MRIAFAVAILGFSWAFASSSVAYTFGSVSSTQNQQHGNSEQRDSEGRKIILGPVGSGHYNNVRIISASVGVSGNTVSVTNSVIEAPVCIQTYGDGVRVTNNTLLCDLCIEFTGGMLTNNTLANNRCSGRGTNRPDVFGW